jgi:diguanylate cyclase (GGDEF)-like protein
MARNLSPFSAFLLSTVGIGCVGLVDYLTGIDLNVLPLYFLPLMFAGRHLRQPTLLALSILVTVVWIGVVYLHGREYPNALTWVFNFVTQGIAFALLAWLLSRLYENLRREQEHSRTDSLTGLSNARAFDEQAESLLRLCHRGRHPITLAYLDLDDFKRANDSRGHLFGDEVLRKVAELARRRFRKTDLFARIGGDEFVAVLPETGAQDARRVLESFRALVAQAPALAACSVTVSIGAVAYAVAPTDLDSMIKAADDVMYRVKTEGKNQVLVTTA